MKISPYLSSKITIFYTLLIVMVVYIHSTYLEMFQYEVADFVWKFWGGYGLCSVANPLFFIISGFLLVGGVTTVLDLLKKLQKRVRTVVVPFILWNAIFVLWYVVLDITPWVSGYVNSTGIMEACADSTYFRLMLILSLAMFGVVLDNNNIYLPWAMSTVPYASFLVAGGRYIKHIVSPEKSNKIWILLCFVITFGISLFYRLDMAWNNITPVIPLPIGAVSGTIMVFMLSSIIEKKCKTLSKILSSVGKETYIVVAFASAIIMMINQYFILNPLVKYLIMTLILCVLAKAKGFINTNSNIKIF